MQRIGPAYLHPTAVVLGDVELGEDVSVWPHAAIRGDVAAITLGPRTNVQDGAVVHCDTDKPQRIGADVTIGHGAIVHGLRVGDGSLLGMGCRVLGGVRIGSRCLIAAGAVVPPNMAVPDEHVVVGVPGRVARPLREDERAYLDWLAPHYVELARRHHRQPDDPRHRPYTGRTSA